MQFEYKKTKFNWKQGRGESKEQMEKLFKKIKDENAVCKSYEVTEKTRPRPEPLNTIEFMKLAS